MSWYVTADNVDDAMGEGVTILLYGDTGDGKTTLIGEYAEDKFKKTGKITRLYTADPGGWRGLKPYVKLGIIHVVDLRKMPRPWEWVGEAIKGKLPIGIGVDGMPIWQLDIAANEKVGVYAFEGLTAFSDVLMQDASKQAASGQNIGGQGVNFRHQEGNVKWAGNSPAHYGNVQTVMTIAVQESFHLPGDVIWTAMARRAADNDTQATILGPQIVGKALTSDVPRWFVYTFRAATIPGNDLMKTKTEHRLYIEDWSDALTPGAKALANNRSPLDSDPIDPFITPASVVGAIAKIEKGGDTALEKIRARVAAARPPAA